MDRYEDILKANGLNENGEEVAQEVPAEPTIEELAVAVEAEKHPTLAPEVIEQIVADEIEWDKEGYEEKTIEDAVDAGLVETPAEAPVEAEAGELYPVDEDEEDEDEY